MATVPYQQLGADAANWQSTGFFAAYPGYDWRDFSAWAWGISRADFADQNLLKKPITRRFDVVPPRSDTP